MNGDQKPKSPDGDQKNAARKTSLDVSGIHDSGEDAARNFDIQRIVLFNEIAGGTAEVIIEHEGQRYRLRATRNGRLLLNK